MSVLNQSGDEAMECPLCMEPLEVDDMNFFPCTCGYQICRFCWHRIRTDENGLCPACRKAYSENPADFKPLSKEEISRLKAEKRLKDQQRKQRMTENRKHLANVRVVQKNLVFVVGLPMRLADADVLKRHEYFGKFGKIHKVVINQSTSYAGSQGPSASAYVTYQRQEDALRAIEAVNNITVDGRIIKTSLGTTKYCSHFMRNQACPKSDCMYLHDLGDQEASFTKEEMHQGKHQEYERKLVQCLSANASSVLHRKSTISSTVCNHFIRENGASISQTKEAWPSLQLCSINNVTDEKEASLFVASPVSQSTDTNGSNIINNQIITSDNRSQHHNNNNNNNNKGESVVASGSNSRRGKTNNDSKIQAVRNKQKNNQNKEKHSGIRINLRSDCNLRSYSSQLGNRPQQIIGQKQLTKVKKDIIDSDLMTNEQFTNGRCKDEYQQIHYNSRQKIRQTTAATKMIEQSLREMKLNNYVQNEYQNQSENEHQREGSTLVRSTSSGSSEELTSNSVERLVADTFKENLDHSTLNSSPLNENVDDQLNSAEFFDQRTKTYVNHRSIYQTDNNSFFSSNAFQKITNIISLPSSLQNSNVDWTATCLTSIPDSFPSVHSSENWQAAFGFQPEINEIDLNITTPSSVPFRTEDFLNDDDNIYLNSDFNSGSSPKLSKNLESSALLTTSSASKFVVDFSPHPYQQRYVTQNQDHCEYIKQNGHSPDNLLVKQDYTNELKPDDDLGFDPFYETQKALAELMENELQLQQQRLFSQQHQSQRSREEHSQSQIQQQYFSSTNLHSQHFPQVAHLAQLQQAHHLQNLQVLQQSHTLMSRLPQNILQQTNIHNSVQSTMSLVGNTIAQRSRLPPPGFPSATTNHMNAFGLGIPRVASTTNTLASTQASPHSYLSNGINKCATESVYSLKDWSEITGHQQLQQPPAQAFHHQSIYQKGNWNNHNPIADWTSIDPAIVSSSRPLQFQTSSTWQFSRFHPPTFFSRSHGAQGQSPIQHWATQPPPGFGVPVSSTPLNDPELNTATQSHTKLISAGSEIENC